jgi:hypothetical protein
VHALGKLEVRARQRVGVAVEEQVLRRDDGALAPVVGSDVKVTAAPLAGEAVTFWNWPP